MSIFCGAIQMSLKIIADTHDRESIEELGDATSINEDVVGARGSGTPLNVNTGAIGANGTVSRLSHKDQEDLGRRLATQRVVVSFMSEPSMNARCGLLMPPAQGWDVAPDQGNCCRSIRSDLVSRLGSVAFVGAERRNLVDKHDDITEARWSRFRGQRFSSRYCEHMLA